LRLVAPFNESNKMIHLQNLKFANITGPISVDNGSNTTAAVDTQGFDYAVIVVHSGALQVAMTALKVQESDSSDMSGAADVDGLIFGTSTNIDGSTSALPAAGDDNVFHLFEIDLKNRKRFLDVVSTQGNGSGTGGLVGISCILGRAAESVVDTASGKGAAEVLRA
tara:strand:+ start:626 stop:1123 length:498 start_codon:yes stop_codon:yes gene_type:complete